MECCNIGNFSCGCFSEIMDIDICTALSDVEEQACIMGTDIIYIHRTEEDISRGSLGSITKRSLLTRYGFKAFPLERYPDYKKLERAGLKEGVEMTAYTPMSTWISYGLIRPDHIGEDFTALETVRSTVLIDGSEMKIDDKGLHGRIGNVPLYIVLGLKHS